MRHDRPGTRRGMVTDAHRRAQDGIGTDERMIADLRTFLDRRPVVVRGDRARADVHMLANRRVPDIGDMPDCRVRADRRLLNLDEIADVRALPDERARPQVAEWPAIRPSLQHRPFERRRDDAAAVGDAARRNHAVWPDDATDPNHCLAAQHAAGLDHRIATDLYRIIDIGMGGVTDCHARPHQPRAASAHAARPPPPPVARGH